MNSSNTPPPLTPPCTLGELIDRWHEVIRGSGLKKVTTDRYRYQLPLLADLRDTPLSELTRPVILDWYDDLITHRGGSIPDAAAGLLRVILEYGWNRGLVVSNQASRLGRSHRPPPRPPLSQTQWDVLLRELIAMSSERCERSRRIPVMEFAQSSATLAAITLLFCGARISEISAAECDMWRAEKRCLGVPNGKTGVQLLVFGKRVGGPFVDAQVRLARAMGSRYIFPSPLLHDRPISKAAVWEVWHAACGRAGIRGVSPHNSRVTAAVEAIEAALPDNFVQQFLNHRHLRTTNGYTQFAVRPGPLLVAEALDEVRLGHAGETIEQAFRVLDPRTPTRLETTPDFQKEGAL